MAKNEFSVRCRFRLFFIITGINLLLAPFAFSQTGPSTQILRSPQGKQEYCALVQNKENFIKLLQLEESRLAFYNPGGFFNFGLCWWHSRLQRSSLYLAIYQPTRARVSDAEVLKILDALYNQRRVVTIAGYSNFYEFTNANSHLITQYLSTSQIIDSIEGEWVNGIMGTSIVNSAELTKMMNTLYIDLTKKGDVTYQMLQMPGLVAHAWLVYGMNKNENGYDIYHVDSNYPLENRVYRYTFGETNLNYNGTSPRFVPYTREQGKMTQAWQIAKKFCQ